MVKLASYLLDSNHASPLVTLSHPLRRLVQAEVSQAHTFAIAIPILTETLFGLSTLPRAAQNLEEWYRLRQYISCFIPDEDDAQLAAELQTALRGRGRQLGTVDALIAAVALRYDLILLSTDRDFEPITELKRENWLD